MERNKLNFKKVPLRGTFKTVGEKLGKGAIQTRTAWVRGDTTVTKEVIAEVRRRLSIMKESEKMISEVAKDPEFVREAKAS